MKLILENWNRFLLLEKLDDAAKDSLLSSANMVLKIAAADGLKKKIPPKNAQWFE